MSDLDKLRAAVEADAIAEGPLAVSELRAFDAAYRIPLDLRDARIAQGITQTELAEKTGIGQPEISRIECCQTNLTIATLGALASALDLEVQLVPRAVSREDSPGRPTRKT